MDGVSVGRAIRLSTRRAGIPMVVSNCKWGSLTRESKFIRACALLVLANVSVGLFCFGKYFIKIHVGLFKH